MLDGLVRHDRLLTDSLNLGVAHLATSPMTGNGNMTTSENHQIISQISQLPVKTEHSYSMAGSDGDSIPDSPLSLHDTGNRYYNFGLNLFTTCQKLVKTNNIVIVIVIQL